MNPVGISRLGLSGRRDREFPEVRLGYVLPGIHYLCYHYHRYHLITLPLQTNKKKLSYHIHSLGTEVCYYMQLLKWTSQNFLKAQSGTRQKNETNHLDV